VGVHGAGAPAAGSGLGGVAGWRSSRE